MNKSVNTNLIDLEKLDIRTKEKVLSLVNGNNDEEEKTAICVRLGQKTLENIKKIAKNKKIKYTSLIRLIIDEYLYTNGVGSNALVDNRNFSTGEET